VNTPESAAEGIGPSRPYANAPEPRRPVVAARIATGTAEAAVVQGKRAHRTFRLRGSVRHGPRSGGSRRCGEGGSAHRAPDRLAEHGGGR